MIHVEDILRWLGEYAPFRYAASWDYCGLQVGDPQGAIERVLVALDPTSDTIGEAEELGCQCLVAHHPLIFRPMKAIRADEFPGNLVVRAIQQGIHVIAVHTNLDAAREGTNHHFARLLSLPPMEPLEIDESWQGESLYGGMGRVGFLPHAMTLKELVEKTRAALGDSELRVVGDPEKRMQRLAVCTGSGGSLIELAIKAGCDVYITGDIKYHEARRAIEAGLALIDVGHFASERLVLEPLGDYLRSKALNHQVSLQVLVASTECDPFWAPGRGPTMV